MDFIHTKQLTPKQKQDIQSLISACKNFEPLSLSAPLEDGLDYFLLYENHQLISMLFLFFPEDTICECCVFTLPSWRQKGYASLLRDKALDYIEKLEEDGDSNIDFCFLVDEHTPSATLALKAIGAEYWYSEYSMERPLTDCPPFDCSILDIAEPEPNLYTASLHGTLIGTCILLPNHSTVYFYGFEIIEAFRGQGYGKNFLLSMLSFLAQKGYSSISLQVSGQNQSAMSLYEKTGFQITDTLSYYLY